MFRLHGVIYRIDKADDGRLRVIDYKTGGPSKFWAARLQKGKKLQLPLYALAARTRCTLANRSTASTGTSNMLSRSEFTLASGAEAAMARAAEYAWEAVDGVRHGRFTPQPPADGCPDDCPATGFCWRYRPAFSE